MLTSGTGEQNEQQYLGSMTVASGYAGIRTRATAIGWICSTCSELRVHVNGRIGRHHVSSDGVVYMYYILCYIVL